MSSKCSILSPFASDLEDGPYSLRHFLPIGTLVLSCSGDDNASIGSCGDHWHDCTHNCLSELILPEDVDLAHDLTFLTSNKLVAATFRRVIRNESRAAHLFVRIYLIPFDLPNVGGVLRRRDEAAVLSPARKHLRALLSRIRCDYPSWDGNVSDTAQDVVHRYLSLDSDGQSLAQLYNTLSSPVLKEYHRHSPDGLQSLTDRILRQNYKGMRTKLHRYQRRSVARMVQQELDPGACPDPLYVPIRGLDGRSFYLQPATMEILCIRPMLSQARGGILCEELGTGKTVMILALIAATVDQLAAPESSLSDPRPVLTPVAFQHFPSQAFSDARKRVAEGNRTQQDMTSPVRIPSLTEFLLHQARVHPDAISVRHNPDRFPVSHLWRYYVRNAPFYHHFEEEPVKTLRTRHRKTVEGPRKMYLTSATLVIVPANLLNQWSGEINKHCRSTLKRLTVFETDPLPLAQYLGTAYDIVIMTHSRFSREANKKDVKALHSWNTCKCPVPAGSSVRIPMCGCKSVDGVSPLLQIRWKRLVIDEGHVAATTTTNLMVLVQHLSIERKWIVTGTPTANLMGLRFGELSANEISSDEVNATILMDDYSDVEPDEGDPDAFLDALDGFALDYPEEAGAHLHRQKLWTDANRKDLTRLGKMLTAFLAVPQFAANPGLFTSHVVDPLMDKSGPLPGSIRVLRQVMESVMIRHRVEDVESDIVLPPLHQETVFLDLDPYGVITYNYIQAGVVINAVDSERVGQDYLLHRRNTALLQELIDNTSQAMFWHADEEGFGVDERMASATDFRRRSREKLDKQKISQADFDMVDQALAVTEVAARNVVWRAMNRHMCIFNRVYNLPSPIYQAWSQLASQIGQVTDQHLPDSYHFITSDHLKTLRKFILRKPLSSVPKIITYGQTVTEAELRAYEIHTANRRKQKGTRKHDQRGREVLATGGNPRGRATVAAKAQALAQLVEVEARQKAMEEDGLDDVAVPQNNLFRMSPVAGVEIGNTTSSKLNYILREIQLYASSAKFLIFSRSFLTLRYIAEALGLIGVQYKITSQGVRVLQQDVTTFETSDTFRVFLMQLKHGARGLNLVTASRVIFCEPVWQADVEAQAIKRVHRIGQTSPVSVKTLAIRNTAEEFMVKRRDDLKRGRDSSSGKLPDLSQDLSMRDFIVHPTFLPEPDLPSVQLRYTLLPSLPMSEDNAPPHKAAPLPVPRLPTSSPSASSSSTDPANASVLEQSYSTPQPHSDHSSAFRTIRIPALKRKADSPAPAAGSLYFKVRRRTELDMPAANEVEDRLEGSSSSIRSNTNQSRNGDGSLTPKRASNSTRAKGVRFVSP